VVSRGKTVVAAASEADARSMHPCGYEFGADIGAGVRCSSPDKAKAECIGRPMA
jgi:hypothetical protein